MRQRKTLLPMSEPDENDQVDATSIASISLSDKRKSIHQIPTYFAFLVIAVLCLMYGGVYLIDKSLPNPYKISDEKNYPDAFIAERAQTHLKGLTDYGPRVVGGKENEILAVNYLIEKLDKIRQNAHISFAISVDHHTTTGAYILGYVPNAFINSYAKVQNVIVKIDGKNTNESILINAHYDSVPTSPGASDDGIMVSVMLETIEKITQKPQAFKRNLIFLFNGAEESQLQAAHGFITQHKWAQTCKTIVNLEAAGHGGKAILFQSGPKRSSSLISHYSSVPHPYGQASGEELFQSNLIPSDTDFRIFRDFGGLSGFDMAFARNGYRYHTKYDNFEDLPLGSYQQIGSNLLALVKSLATDPEEIIDDDSKVVYFDVFSWFLISYSTLAAYIVNIFVAISSLVVAIFSAPRLQLSLSKSSFFYLLITTGAIVGSWICAAALVLLVALLVDFVGCSMSWYGSPVIIFGLYVAPLLGTFTGVMFLYKHYGKHTGKNLSSQSQIQMHIVRLIWSLILFIGTVYNLRSVYVILIAVLFNTVASFLILVLKWQHTVRKWQILSFVFTILPTIFSMYAAISTLGLFVPITGRIGANKNPDFLICLVTLLLVLITATYYIPYSTLVNKQYWIPVALFISFGITLIVVMSGGVFPYSSDKQAPTPQRFTIFHTNRVHHAANESVAPVEQSGIFIMNNDRNSPQSIADYIDLNLDKNHYDISADCAKYPACGMPLSNPRMLQIVEASTWIPFSKAAIHENISLAWSRTANMYTFKVEGPDHLTVFIRPHNGAKILKTHLHGVHEVEVASTNLLYINHVYGREKIALEFSIELKLDANYVDENQPLIDFVASGKYYNFKKSGKMDEIGDEFWEFIEKFPDWADVVPALATYESFII